MFVVYGYRNRFKRLSTMENKVCSNCGHNARHTLCCWTKQATLFWIPLVNFHKKYGIICESCGNQTILSRKEYQEIKSK